MESQGISHTGPLKGLHKINHRSESSAESGTDAHVKHKAPSKPEGLSIGKDVSTGLSGKGDCSSLLLNDVKPGGGDAGNGVSLPPLCAPSVGVFGGRRRR